MATVSYRLVVSFDVVGGGTMPEQAAVCQDKMNDVAAAMTNGETDGDVILNGDTVGYWRLSIAS